jgi:hypothetical protein
MIRKVAASSFVLATLIGLSLASTGVAEARKGRTGAFVAGTALGVVGGAIVGTTLARPGYADEPGYVAHPAYVHRRCRIEQREVEDEDGYGTHIEEVKVCPRY